ncbi:MAG: beta-ketoacyl-ACP synthase II [bacterium]
MPKIRAVVTGIGAITPLALTAQDTWQKLLQGKSGIAEITLFDTADFNTKIAGEVQNFDPLNYMDKKEARRMDRYCQMAIAASEGAMQDADLHRQQFDAARVGVILSSGIGGMQTFENEARKLIERGSQRISPFFIPMMIADIAAGQVSMRYGLRGPNYAITSACASSANALVDAMRLIQQGDADIIVAGGAEAPITQLGVAGFNAMKALSTRNNEPEKASRPFDRDRDGFVMGEGAAVLIVENLDHALKRGANIYAELAGAGLSADAYHLTAPVPDGIGAQQAMALALKDAELQPEEIQYINAHGTSTPANDKTETFAISKVFGSHAENIQINSTKSMIGHLLGASGAAETVAVVMALTENQIHPTINLENSDPECFLNYTPNVSVEKTVDNALSNSFGFGGHNVSLAFRRFSTN